MKWLTYLFTAGLGSMALAKVIKRLLLKYLIKTAYLPSHSKLYYSTLKLIEGRSPKLFDFQDSLPDLPVPDLAQTCKAYLDSIKPLVSAEQFKVTEEVVKEFLEKDGPELQKLLLQRASQHRNWLSDWWLEYAYLRFRGPLPVNISFYGYEPMYSPSKFTDQCKKAAYLVRRSLEFKKRLDSQSLEPMRVGGVVPVDMDGYRYIYGTTRIAAKDKDIMRTYVPEKNAHILLCIGSALFTVPVIVDGKYASEEQIEVAIRNALKEADNIGRWSTPNISIMTSENRDTWANTRAHLLDISETNRTSMEAIEQALFAIVLHEDSHTKPGQDPEDAMNEVNRVLFVDDGRRYWFDKCFSFVIFSNGRSGFNVEHTWADAPIVLHHMEYIYNSPDNGGPKGFGTEIKANKLQWEVDEAVHQSIQLARLNFDLLCKGVALRAILFKGFGKELAKKSKISPDALCQAALQVAGLKYFGHPVLTYESAATRTFYKGRTETIRSATQDMVKFANAFIKFENNIQDDETKKLLKDALNTAAKTHSKISRICSAGQGIDRHLLGLKLTALLNGKPMPKIFTDDSYKLEYRLSTSQTPLTQEYFKTKYQDLVMGGGFGPTSSDGIGCSYHVLSDVLYFNLSATGSDPSGNVNKFAAALESTLESLQRLLN